MGQGSAAAAGIASTARGKRSKLGQAKSDGASLANKRAKSDSSTSRTKRAGRRVVAQHITNRSPHKITTLQKVNKVFDKNIVGSDTGCGRHAPQTWQFQQGRSFA